MEPRLPPFRRPLVVVLIGLIVLMLIILAVIWEGHLRFTSGPSRLMHIVRRGNPGTSAVLLYLEESGIPLPLPGDVFVAYGGVTAPQYPLAWIGVGLMLVAAVVGGASNLFLLSRRYGRRLAHGRVGVALHLTPQRLARAERWFQRWGPLALIFGRHIPGARIPITVAAAVFNVSWKVFALSVTVSTIIWVSALMTVGIHWGPAAIRTLNHHQAFYFIIPIVFALAWIVFTAHRLWVHRKR